MKIVVLVLVQLLFGWGVLNKVKYSKDLLTKLALSYLIGLFGTSLSIYIIELLHLHISFLSMFSINLVLALAVNVDIKRFINSLNIFKTLNNPKINIFDLIITAVAGYFLYYSVWRMYHLPVVPYDALVGIDLLAKAAVEEGHVVSSIFTRPDLKILLSTQPFYAPLTSFNQIAYRLAGAPFGQIWIAFATIAFCTFAYVRLRTLIHPILAGISIVFIFCSTELYAYTYLLQTDLTNAIFFAIGTIFTLDFLKDKSLKYDFWLAVLFMFIAVWTRIETIVLIAFMSLLIAWEYFKEKKYKELFMMTFIFVAIPMIANILWNVVFYNFVFPFHPESKGEIVWAGKYSSTFTSNIFERMNYYLFSTDYWGYVLYIYLLVVIANILIYKDKISIYTLLLITIFYFSFFLMLHHFDKLNVQATYRRGIFKLILMLVLFFGELKILQALGAKIRNWSHKVN